MNLELIACPMCGGGAGNPDCFSCCGRGFVPISVEDCRECGFIKSHCVCPLGVPANADEPKATTPARCCRGCGQEEESPYALCLECMLEVESPNYQNLMGDQDFDCPF